jgi:hypothetical protein
MEELSPAERWAPIPGFDGYEASDLGRIRSVDRTVETVRGPWRLKGRVLKPVIEHTRPDYKRATVHLGKSPTLRVATLVLLAFVGPAPEGTECCHNNGNSLDNRLSNLRWDTHGENILDQVRHGTNEKRNRTHCPRGHVLAEPNLEKGRILKEGHRKCLACGRASNVVNKAKRGGTVLDMQEISDWYYGAIMRGETHEWVPLGNHKGNRTHCPRGHVLAEPNLTRSSVARGHRACLSCNRAMGYVNHHKKHGRTYDVGEEADRYYKAIMSG